jgi:hypothetical protein
MAAAALPDRADSPRLLYWRKQIHAQTIESIDISQDNRVQLCDASKVLDA